MKGTIMDRFDRSPYRPGWETWGQYVVRAGHYTTHRVCGCCESIIANGQGCHSDQCATCGRDVGEGLFAAASRAEPGHLTLGAFIDDCGHDASDSEEHVEQCERFGFMQSSCTWCGTPLHGDRVAAIFWPAQPTEEDPTGMPDTDFEPYCTTHGHAPVAGMMHVNSEDLDHVAAMRGRRQLPPVECEQCDMVYLVDRTWVQVSA